MQCADTLSFTARALSQPPSLCRRCPCRCGSACSPVRRSRHHASRRPDPAPPTTTTHTHTHGHTQRRPRRRPFSCPPLLRQRTPAQLMRTVHPSRGDGSERCACGASTYADLADACLMHRCRSCRRHCCSGIHSLSSVLCLQRACLALSKAKYVARAGRQERQPKLHRRRAAVRGGGAAGGSLNTRAAAHAAADAEGTHSVHRVYSNVRGAARHHVAVSDTAATGAQDRDAVLLHLFDSATAQDGHRPGRATEGAAGGWTASPVVRGGVTRECTTTAVLTAQTLPPPRVPRPRFARPSAWSSEAALIRATAARISSTHGSRRTSSVMLDPTQAKAVDLAARGFNICVMGGAGMGRSQTLRAIVAALRSREVHESEETLRAVANAASSPQRGGSYRRADAREPNVARKEGQSGQRGFAGPSPPLHCKRPPSRLPERSRATTSVSRSKPRSSSAACAAPALSNVCATAMAINTFAGIGLGRGSSEQLLHTAQKNAEAAQRWRQCRVLLIDEVSTPEASLFEPLDYIARRVRRCAHVRPLAAFR